MTPTGAIPNQYALFHQIFVLSDISPTLCVEVQNLQPHKFELFAIISFLKLQTYKFLTRTLSVVISQTHWLVSQERLARGWESPPLLSTQWCHLASGGSKFTAGVSHHTPPPPGGGGLSHFFYILNIFIFNYYIH